MKARTLVAPLLLLLPLVAPPERAAGSEVLIAEDERLGPYRSRSRVWKLDDADLTLLWEQGPLTSSGDSPAISGFHAVVGPDGALYSAESLRRLEFDTGTVERFDIGHGDRGLEFAFDGRLLTAHKRDPNGVLALDTTTLAVEVIHVADELTFDVRGMTVFRSGPHEGDILLLGRNRREDTFHLRRLELQSDGTYLPAGDTAALDLHEGDTCPVPADRNDSYVRDIALRRSGLAVVIGEPCTHEVQEYDLDGNLLRVLATLEPDPDTPSPPRTGDHLHAIHVDVTDTVWAVMVRRVWSIDESGATRLDHAFDWAAAVTDATYVPFESEGVGCHARGVGWWKRQCRGTGEALARPGAAGEHLERVSRTPAHPLFGLDRFSTLRPRVDAELARHGVTTCEALWNERPSEPRTRALAHLAGLLLDIADKALARHCVVPGPDGLTIGETIDRVHDLLEEGTDAADREAARLATRAVAANGRNLEGRR